MQRIRQSPADRHAIDGGNHRYRQFVEPSHLVGEAHLRVVGGLEGRGRRGRPRLPGPTQVRAGAKTPAGTGQDGGPMLPRPQPVQGRVEPIKQGAVDGVEHLRPVEGDPGNAVIENVELHCCHAATIAMRPRYRAGHERISRPFPGQRGRSGGVLGPSR